MSWVIYERFRKHLERKAAEREEQRDMAVFTSPRFRTPPRNPGDPEPRRYDPDELWFGGP